MNIIARSLAVKLPSRFEIDIFQLSIQNDCHLLKCMVLGKAFSLFDAQCDCEHWCSQKMSPLFHRIVQFLKIQLDHARITDDTVWLKTSNMNSKHGHNLSSEVDVTPYLNLGN